MTQEEFKSKMCLLKESRGNSTFSISSPYETTDELSTASDPRLMQTYHAVDLTGLSAEGSWCNWIATGIKSLLWLTKNKAIGAQI